MVRVLVDDVRRFVDDRECIVYRTSADALAGLRALAAANTVVDELWLDHDLGGNEPPEGQPDHELDHAGSRLTVSPGRVGRDDVRGQT